MAPQHSRIVYRQSLAHWPRAVSEAAYPYPSAPPRYEILPEMQASE